MGASLLPDLRIFVNDVMQEGGGSFHISVTEGGGGQL